MSWDAENENGLITVDQMVSLGCLDSAPYKWLQGHMNELLAWERLIKRGRDGASECGKERNIHFYCAYDALSLYLETSTPVQVLHFL